MSDRIRERLVDELAAAQTTPERDFQYMILKFYDLGIPCAHIDEAGKLVYQMPEELPVEVVEADGW